MSALQLENTEKIDTQSATLVTNIVTRNKESVLHNLIADCITYRLLEQESMEYICTRYKKILDDKKNLWRCQN